MLSPGVPAAPPAAAAKNTVKLDLGSSQRLEVATGFGRSPSGYGLHQAPPLGTRPAHPAGCSAAHLAHS